MMGDTAIEPDVDKPIQMEVEQFGSLDVVSEHRCPASTA